jgi:hypothetical protein
MSSVLGYLLFSKLGKPLKPLKSEALLFQINISRSDMQRYQRVDRWMVLLVLHIGSVSANSPEMRSPKVAMRVVEIAAEIAAD